MYTRAYSHLTIREVPNSLCATPVDLRLTPRHMWSRSESPHLLLRKRKHPDVSTKPTPIRTPLTPSYPGVQAGGIYVNQEAAWALRAAFGECQIQRDVMEEWLRNATNDFEATIKREFPRTSGRYSLAIDRASYHNKLLGVKNGRIMLNQYALFEFLV